MVILRLLPMFRKSDRTISFYFYKMKKEIELATELINRGIISFDEYKPGNLEALLIKRVIIGPEEVSAQLSLEMVLVHRGIYNNIISL